MGMQTLYFKEHEGIAQRPVRHLSAAAAAAPSMPWWNVLGSQTGCAGSQLKTMSVERQPSAAGDEVVVTVTDQGGMEKETPTEFNIFPGSPGDGKSINEEQKSLPAQSFFSVQATLAAQLDLGFGQQMICAKYPPVDQCYGIFSAYGPQVPGRMLLPMDMSTDEGPIYVNAKQYHGILRRRKSRAKAELENRPSRARKQYMHHSRHLHAMRRPRGSGGRFLTKNEIDKMAKEQGNNFHFSQHAGSQSSGGVQSDSGSANSSKEAHGVGAGLNLAGGSSSEVTSMFSRDDVMGCFQIKSPPPPFHSFPGMMNTGGHGFVMPSKWVSAAVVDNCSSSNLKV